MSLVDSLYVLLYFGIKVPPPTPADFATVEESQVQHTRLVCLSILDVINNSYKCETGLFKGHLSPYDVFPEHIHFPGVCYWKGQMLFTIVLRLLHPLVKKEMLQLVNVPTCWKRYLSERNLEGFPFGMLLLQQ